MENRLFQIAPARFPKRGIRLRVAARDEVLCVLTRSPIPVPTHPPALREQPIEDRPGFSLLHPPDSSEAPPRAHRVGDRDRLSHALHPALTQLGALNVVGRHLAAADLPEEPV